MKAWKRAAYDQALIDIIPIEEAGHNVVRLSDWHWRIDGLIDVWPSSKKYRRGDIVRTYQKLEDVLKSIK